MWMLSNVFLVFALTVGCTAYETVNNVIQLTEDNWSDILQGEWLIEFHAPWCPACKQFSSVWQDLAAVQEPLGVKVAQVDVSKNPAMNGQFMITSLPSIYHVRDRVFRYYTGRRSKDDFVRMIKSQQWDEIPAIPWYYSPESIQMRLAGKLFQFSFAMRDFHDTITTSYGLPSWVSYLLLAGVTIIIGAIIGFICVAICDCFMGPNYATPTPRLKADSVKPTERGQGDTPKEEGKEEEDEEKKDSEKEEGEDTVDTPDTPPQEAPGGTPSRLSRRSNRLSATPGTPAVQVPVAQGDNLEGVPEEKAVAEEQGEEDVQAPDQGSPTRNARRRTARKT